MREVFIHQDSARVGLYQSILDGAGIPTYVRNGISNNSVTDLPSPVFFPALCVVNDEDYQTALELLRTVHKPEPSDAPDWRCAACGEGVPGNFDTCWKCGVERVKDETAAAPQAAPAAAPATAPASPPPIPATSGDERRVVNAFRWLLILNFLWFFTTGFALQWLGVDPSITTQGEVSEFLEKHSPSKDSQNRAALAGQFFNALQFVAFPLCFCLSPYGRRCMVLSAVIWVLMPLGYAQSLWPRGWMPPTLLSDLIFGAVIAMMYLPPLSSHFGRKPQ